MMTCLEQTASQRSESFWVLYWHRRWQEQFNPLAAEHIAAYLQEPCYWVARKIARNFADCTPVADLFQVAIARVPKILKHFKPQSSQNLKGYAELVFKNSLKDWLQVQQKVTVCTDWSLLYRVSRKRLIQALQWKAFSPQTIEQYVLAWECFRELYVIDDLQMMALKRPDMLTWQAIAQGYNTERLKQLSSAVPTESPAHLEQWLLHCAKAVREFLHPRMVSVDAPPAGQDSGSMLDTLADGSKPMPLDVLIDQEDDLVRRAQSDQLTIVLTDALAALDPQAITLLQVYYTQDLTQEQIANQLGIKQYQVSRQLGRIRRSLLKKVAQWSQETLHISLTPEVVDAMSLTLEEWLHQQLSDEGRERPS
jgi:RNA polymerase sigma factor (sigma-70 family)